MKTVTASCEQRIATKMADAEQRFADIWRQIDQGKRGSLYEGLDLHGLEGSLALCVRLDGGDWLEMALDRQTATTGIRWVTYHVADCSEHAERAIYPPRSLALWRAAGYYLGRAMEILAARRRAAI
jgi:hypothetical protein